MKLTKIEIETTLVALRLQKRKLAADLNEKKYRARNKFNAEDQLCATVNTIRKLRLLLITEKD